MPKFMSIPYEVTAVQWNGEITDEIRELFMHVGVREIATKCSNPPMLVVPRTGGGDPELAEVGDWIVWFNEDEDEDENDSELGILDEEGFRSMYEARQAAHLLFLMAGKPDGRDAT